MGEAACLGAALCWAVAVALFRRPIAEHGARAVNLAKSLIAAPLFAATTYVAIFLMMAGIARSPAAVAAVLLATVPIWSLLLEARSGTPLTARGLGGTLLAVAGVGVLSAGG